MKRIVFGITPIAKPRMVRSDRWAGRPCVTRYWEYKDELVLLTREKQFELGDTLDIVFYLPMPKSWSGKKKDRMEGQPHQVKPDGDNLVKAFWDCLSAHDQNIYDFRVRKFWGKTGRIEVFL